MHAIDCASVLMSLSNETWKSRSMVLQRSISAAGVRCVRDIITMFCQCKSYYSVVPAAGLSRTEREHGADQYAKCSS